MSWWLWSSLTFVCLASVAFAQQTDKDDRSMAPPKPVLPSPEAALAAAPLSSEDGSFIFCEPASGRHSGGFISGNHNFPNFIGFMSNPLFAVDPRAMTTIMPINDIAWVSNAGRLPSGWIELPGAGLNVALSERASMGITQGGYAWADFRRAREGWLNLGGYAQYTVIQNIPSQFILTAGLHWEAPIGSKDIFQGRGAAKLAPYITAGKEYGEYHFLGTFGYAFPAGESNPSTEIFYGVLHMDRRCFGWFYPLIELNWVAHTSRVDLTLDRPEGIIDLGSFSGAGNLVTLTFGANAVLVPEKWELGAGYTTSIASQHGFDVNALIVKMIYRF